MLVALQNKRKLVNVIHINPENKAVTFISKLVDDFMLVIFEQIVSKWKIFEKVLKIWSDEARIFVCQYGFTSKSI